MKKYVSLLIISALTLFSCSEKSVDLTNVDILTGGKEKEWVFEEFFISGENVVETQECYKDDTAIFSKGNQNDTLYSGPVYTWKKNAIKCGITDEDWVSDFFVTDDGKQLLFENRTESWNIDVLDSKQIILHSTHNPDVKMKLKAKNSSIIDTTKTRKSSF
jgi:hypothetical protein